MAPHKDFAATWHVIAALGQTWQCSTTDAPLSFLLVPGLLPGEQLLFVDLWIHRQQSPGPECRESSGT